MRQLLFSRYRGIITGNDKLLVLFSLLCYFFSVLPGNVHAQPFNKKFYYPSAQVDFGDVAPNEGNNHLFFTTNTYDQQSSTNTLYLTRTDLMGNFPLSVRMPGGGVHKIIETIDNGVIVTFMNQWTLLVIKFDVNLVQQWVRRIPLMPTTNLTTWALDIEKVYYPNLNQEHYFVVAPTGTNAPGYTPPESVYMAARLTQGGAVVWCKTYVDANKPTSPYLYVNESIGCIEPMPNGGQWNFLIGSGREHFNWTVGNQFRMSYLMIDENGAVLSPCRAYTGNSTQPHRSRIKWDGQNFACVFTDYEQPNPTGAISGSCLMQLTPALNFVQGKIYATLQENYGFSIQQSTDGNYIMGTGVSGWGVAYPQHIKLDVNTLSLIWAKSYNVNLWHWLPSQLRTTASDFNYCTVERDPSVMRVLKSDNLGFACGAEESMVWHKDFTPTYDDYTYVDLNNPNNMQIPFPYSPVTIFSDSCYAATPNPAIYKTLQNGGNEEIEGSEQQLFPSKLTVSIFPTILNNENGSVNCSITSPENKEVSVTVANVVGQIVYKETKTVTAGTNVITIPAEKFSTGMNIVKVIIDGRAIQTTKVLTSK